MQILTHLFFLLGFIFAADSPSNIENSNILTIFVPTTDNNTGGLGVLPPTQTQDAPFIIISVIVALIGLFLTFNGRRFFKTFLSLLGFITGFFLAFCVIVNQNLDVLADMRLIGIPIVAGALVGGLFLWFYKAAIYIGAATGGFFLGSFILSLKPGSLITNDNGRLVFLGAFIAIATALVHFFEKEVTTIASAIIGSFVVTTVADIYVKSGLIHTAFESIKRGVIPNLKRDEKAFGVMALFLGLTVAGIITQLKNKNTQVSKITSVSKA